MSELKILKQILKADLTKNELKTVIFLLSIDEKTIKLTNAEIAEKLGFTASNTIRTLKKLKSVNVIGERKNGIFIKSINSWKHTKTK
jgi:GTP-sensing pleiotropic transcriptional regulator CodY